MNTTESTAHLYLNFFYPENPTYHAGLALIAPSGYAYRILGYDPGQQVFHIFFAGLEQLGTLPAQSVLTQATIAHEALQRGWNQAETVSLYQGDDLSNPNYCIYQDLPIVKSKAK